MHQGLRDASVPHTRVTYKALTVIYDRGRWSVQQTNMLRQYLAELAKG